jgi:hypothetical protein
VTDERPERAYPTLLEQMGGVTGIVASTIPVAVFVLVNVLSSLQPAIIAAVAAGALVFVYRVVRKQPLQPAVSGLLGVGVAAFIAARTGEARGFYLPGLLTSAAFGLAFLVSVIVRWPLAGVVWHAINGHGQGWREDPRLLRAYTWASLLWTAVFASRVALQGLLYYYNEETWLGVARLLMGYPLVGVALIGTVWAVRRAQRSAPQAAEPPPAAPHAPQEDDNPKRTARLRRERARAALDRSTARRRPAGSPRDG